MRVASLIVLGWMIAGCESPKPAEPAAEAAPEATAEAPAPTEAPAEAAAAKPAEKAGPVVSDPTFELSLKPAGKYVAGELGRVDLKLQPLGEYHVNQDYPISVELSGEGVTLAKSKLTRPDAAEFGEKVAAFEVPFTPTEAGERELRAHVRFAVCTEETCVPDERTLALALVVE